MNSNKLIALNSTILYIRLAIVSICGLLATRYALQALGVDDFGLFSVVGGVISIISIVNTIMLSTSNRFIAVSIGKQDLNQANKVFNVSLIIHIVIALFTFFLAFPLGHWYIYNFINYIGDIDKVITVYNYSILASIISFIGVPYNGLLLAKEKFLVFCSTDILSSIIKLIFCYLLIENFEDKLLVYTIILSITTAYPTLIFFLYCRVYFYQYVKFKFVHEYKLYKEIINFSIWVGLGAIVTVLKSQGTALIINLFFNTVVNTALGIANSVNAILLTFSNNVHKSISPQIIKSYSSNQMERCISLVVFSSKISYLIMFFISIPFLLFPELIFKLWLNNVPDYVVPFTILIIIDALVTSLNAGIPDLVFASGKIKIYQSVVYSLSLLSIVVGFLLLYFGAPAVSLLMSYILFSIIIVFVRQIILNKILKFDSKILIFKSYIPSVYVTLLFIPTIFIKSLLPLSIYAIISYVYFMVLIFIVGFTDKEKKYIKELIKR